MPTSQFRQYTSADVGAPPMSGATGSLIAVLNYCLVSGSNWSQSFVSGSVYAAYQPPSGSRLHLYVNDSGPTFAAGGKEAWITGWENITGSGAGPTGNTTGSVGVGVGQFPLPAQSLTDGKVVCRKSVAANTGSIPYWQVYADSYTMYAFFMTGDIATYSGYFTIWFGDVYSLKGVTDEYRCMIHGRQIVNSAAAGSTSDNTDMVGNLNVNTSNGNGMYMARSFSGVGTGITVNKLGDGSKYGVSIGTMVAAVGTGTAPNPADNSFSIAPLTIWEHATLAIRGRVRGLWYWGHPLTTLTDGQVISGSNSQVGKLFKKIGPGVNSGMWLVEISNTVETN
jgi:hypothetical protein